MVTEQLVRRGITDRRVLEAIGRVPREEFVPPSLEHKAYDDCALPIGYEQTISQPFTVAFMCQESRLKGSDTVLEVGTGSGYGAAVLSLLVEQCIPSNASSRSTTPPPSVLPDSAMTTSTSISTTARSAWCTKHPSTRSSAPPVRSSFRPPTRTSSPTAADS